MPEISVSSSPSSRSKLPSEHLSSIGPSNNNHSLKQDVHQVEQTGFSFSPPASTVQYYNLFSKREFICGTGAAFINICITFPINKAIFRQQLDGVSSLRALRQLQKDGLRLLYRGLLPPLLQKTTSMSIMFGSYKRCQDFLQEVAPSLSVVPNHTLSALIAGTLEAALAPFERVQTLMQNRHFHDQFSNTLDTFKSLRHFGVAEYYRGLTVIILRNGPSNVCFFLGREFLQNKGPLPQTQSEKIMKDFICGACLGALISCSFFPFNVIKTRMQSQVGGPFAGVWQTFQLVLSERDGSFRQLFKGVHLNFTRSFISWGIINASYEFLLHTFFQPKVKNK